MALLGQWHLSAGRIDQARQCFEAVLRWNPESIQAKEALAAMESQAPGSNDQSS
jgi:hypothetical protein